MKQMLWSTIFLGWALFNPLRAQDAKGQLSNGQLPLRFIELVTLNSPYKVKDHIDYHQTIKPIMDKNGLRTISNYEVVKKARGSAPDHVAMIGVYSLESMEKMNRIFEDPEYLKHVEKRDLIHDMPNMTMYLGKPIVEGSFDRTKMIIVDLIVMNPSHTSKERDEYFTKVEKIGAKYGLRRFAAYEISRFMGGHGPRDVSLINLYEADKETMQQLSSDPEYQKNMIPIRNRLFNMTEVSVFMTRAAN